MPTGSLRNVALVQVGDWAASEGDGHVTPADLVSIAEAYQDQLIDRPVLKIGHQDDNVFNAAVNDGAGDGEPAYGWIENVAIGSPSNADRPRTDTVYGDIVGMPGKLAEIAPTAYRHRSVELLRKVVSRAGKQYSAILSGLAFLGIARPAVKTLADVEALYSGAGTIGELVTLEVIDGVPAANVEHVATFLSGLAAVNDTTLIPPSAENPSHPEPVDNDPRTKERTMPALTKEAVLAALDAEGDKSIEDRLAELTAPEETDEEKAAREKAEADQAAADAKKAAEDKAAADAAAGGAPAPADLSAAAPGVVTLSQAQYDELTAGIEQGTNAAKILDAQRRDALVNDAFSSGKIAKTELTEWRAALDRDEEGTATLLSKLTPRFSVVELGDDAAASQLTDGQKAAEDAFLAELTGGTVKAS